MEAGPVPADGCGALAFSGRVHRSLLTVGAKEWPLRGTCDLRTVGRRTGQVRRVEIWYIVVDEQVVITGTPGVRHWLANLREHPEAVLHRRDPDRDVEVVAREITDESIRRRVAEQAWYLQPWYAEQPYSIDDWVAEAPMVILMPTAPG